MNLLVISYKKECFNNHNIYSFYLQVRYDLLLLLSILMLNLLTMYSLSLPQRTSFYVLFFVIPYDRISRCEQLIDLNRRAIVWGGQFLREQVVLIGRRGNLLSPTVHLWFLLWLSTLILRVETCLSLIGEIHGCAAVLKGSVYWVLLLLLVYWILIWKVVLSAGVLLISCVRYLASFNILNNMFTSSSAIIASSFLADIYFIKCRSV